MYDVDGEADVLIYFHGYPEVFLKCYSTWSATWLLKWCCWPIVFPFSDMLFLCWPPMDILWGCLQIWVRCDKVHTFGGSSQQKSIHMSHLSVCFQVSCCGIETILYLYLPPFHQRLVQSTLSRSQNILPILVYFLGFYYIYVLHV